MTGDAAAGGRDGRHPGDVVHIVAGRYEAEHPRHVPNSAVSRLAEWSCPAFVDT